MKRRFFLSPKRVFWVELGHAPDLLSELTKLVKKLGGIIDRYVPNKDSLRKEIARMLANRRCLIVVDNVWQRKHAQSFFFEASGCRMLITTRDAEISRELGAAVYSVPVMSVAEAVTLLDDWSEGAIQDISIREQIVTGYDS